ncbi:TrkH family potassium uptake protein [Rhodovibrio salinarum]|uniref:Trk system potassium uptake protein n=1 Tax=Rhodovibrio salinarum TaxID=1087 RepID=A0A934QJQ6_9PROT|nr:TrkH family potassium uptake protein [Rhodovibrio salinarum]MBK1698179.1 potassium transporter TrkH [Rhodovibrio salinarum]
MPRLQPVGFLISLLLASLSVAMLIPAAVDLAYGNPDWHSFLVAAAVTLSVAGMGGLTTRGGPLEIGVRQAFVLTATAWIATAVFAALPLSFSSLGLSYTDALFEAMSGLTTTGSTVLTGLDTMPPGLLLWRSLLQWMGGIGIIVLGMAILPFLRVGGMQLFHTESSDRSDKVLPRPGQIATAIGSVYLALTAACTLAYIAAGMSGFDAINHAMTTVATGGYSTSDGSLGTWREPAVHWIATVFMLAGSLPFALYVRTLQRRPDSLFRDSQVRVFLAVLAAIVAGLALWLSASGQASGMDAVRLAAFNVVSVATTTGYAVADYGQWGGFAVALFFVLTFVGGCTGSTAGGIKIFRFEILVRMVSRLMAGLQTPHRIYPLTYRSVPLSDDVTTGVIAFFTFFIGTFGILALALGFFGMDFTTALSGAATAIANVGPGLGERIGPAGNFADLPDTVKWLLAAGMLIGRLEVFTLFVLFTPAFWRA